MTERPESPSCASVESGWSQERFAKDFEGMEILEIKRSDSPSVMSYSSMVKSINMSGTGIEDNLSSKYWSAKSAAESGLESMGTYPSHRTAQYTDSRDVACDLCKRRNLRAHIHLMENTQLKEMIKEVQNENLTLKEENLTLKEENKMNLRAQAQLMENTQLKKRIGEMQKNHLTLKKENKTLKLKISELRLPAYLCRGKIPVAADLVLDPDTAHSDFMLSDDGKQVRQGEQTDIHHSTQRFDKWESALATEGFSSGRHYWEVEVNREFTIGVTRESAQRKGRFSFSPARGYWCLCHYTVFTALEEPSRPLPIDTAPRVLGVCIDVDEKWVTFYNTETKAHIYTFRSLVFTDGEKIFPIFNTLSTSVDLKNKTV